MVNGHHGHGASPSFNPHRRGWAASHLNIDKAYKTVTFYRKFLMPRLVRVFDWETLNMKKKKMKWMITKCPPKFQVKYNHNVTNIAIGHHIAIGQWYFLSSTVTEVFTSTINCNRYLHQLSTVTEVFTSTIKLYCVKEVFKEHKFDPLKKRTLSWFTFN